MAKTNYTKVEDLLKANLNKMEVDKLGKLADIAQKIGKPEMRKLVEKAAIAGQEAHLDESMLLHALHHAFKEFKSDSFYKDLGITSEDLQKLLKKNRNELTTDEWNQLQELRLKVVEFRKKQETEQANETQIDQERHKHVNKRFNVKDKWLPLQ